MSIDFDDKARRGIAVFCSATSGLPATYTEAARSVGESIARAGYNLVYGGSRSGLMEEVSAGASSVKGANIVGVMPKYMVDRGMESEHITMAHYCSNIAERKEIMMRESVACIALPGGIGTTDEVMTVLASNQIGEQHLRVILYDVDGFWQPLMSLLAHFESVGVCHDATRRVSVAATYDELMKLLQEL